MITCEQSSKYFDIIAKFSEDMSRFLQVAFAHGAIVAGGFPRIMRRTDEVTLSSLTQGDVDLFFRDKQRAELFLFTMKAGYPHIHIENSKGGYATDMLLRFQETRHAPDGPTFQCRVQAITCRYGEPEDILEQFDIHNCMVGFDDEYVWYHTKQATYEAMNLLSVANWGNPLLASRLAKYLHNHDYDGIVPEDREQLASWLLKTYDRIPVNGNLDDFKFLDRHVFRHYVARIMRSETALDVPELRSFFDMFHPSETHNWDYNAGLHAFKERTGISIPLPERPQKLPIPVTIVNATSEAKALGLGVGDLDPFNFYTKITVG